MQPDLSNFENWMDMTRGKKPSEREREIIQSALEHAKLMDLGTLSTGLLLAFVERVFWSGRVEGLNAAIALAWEIQGNKEKANSANHSQD